MMFYTPTPCCRNTRDQDRCDTFYSKDKTHGAQSIIAMQVLSHKDWPRAKHTMWVHTLCAPSMVLMSPRKLEKLSHQPATRNKASAKNPSNNQEVSDNWTRGSAVH